MAIYAYEKIKKSLMELCSNSDYQTFDLLDHSKEIKRQQLQELGDSFDISCFQKKYPDLDATIKNYVFSNGLEVIYIEYTFKNRKGHPCTQRDISVLCQSQMLVHILFQSKIRTYLNVLKDIGNPERSIPIGEKEVEISKMNVLINSKVGPVFTSYYNLTDDTLMQEVYSSGCEILKSLNVSDSYEAPFDDYDQITIRYRDAKPVSMQLESDFSLEDFEYDSHSLKDVSEVLEGIQKDVDSICEKIKFTIYQHTKVEDGIQKKIGMK